MGSPKKFCGLSLQRDGGYAFVVLAAAYLPQMASIGFAYSVAVLLNSWRIEYGDYHSAALISAVGSLNCAFLFGSGVLASFLIDKIGHRFTVVIGGAMTTVGYIMSYAAVNIWMLLVGYGFFVGVGFGLIYMGSVTIVSLWFEKYRAAAVAFASSGNGLGTFVNAYLLNVLIGAVGWRATMLIQAAIVAQCCVVGMLLLPYPSPSSPRSSLENDDKVVAEEATALTAMKGDDITDIEVKTSNGGFFTDAAQLFKNARFICFFINNITWPIGIVVFYTFCFGIAMELGGFDTDNASWAVACIGLIDTVTRIVTGFMSSYLNISPSVFFFIGQLGFGCVICITPVLNASVNPFVASVLFGVFFGSQLGALVTTTAELFDPEKISTVLGILIVANGFGNGVGPIVASIILKELNNNYTLVYIIFGIIVFVGLAVMAPFFISHWRRTSSCKSKQHVKG